MNLLTRDEMGRVVWHRLEFEELVLARVSIELFTKRIKLTLRVVELEIDLF